MFRARVLVVPHIGDRFIHLLLFPQITRPGRELTAKQKPDRYASDCARDEALADARASA